MAGNPVLKLVLAGVLCVTAVGCVNFQANYLAPKYGEIAADGEGTFPSNQSIVMSPDAPSISQGFKPAPKEKDPKDTPGNHAGLDMVADVGTPVLAAANGVVIKSTYGPAYGHQVSILHLPSLDGRQLKTNYYHLKSRNVAEGDQIARGNEIGTLGRTGTLAAFPHLHFELRIQGENVWDPLNPHLFWADGIGKVSCFKSTQNYPESPMLITYPVQCRDPQ